LAAVLTMTHAMAVTEDGSRNITEAKCMEKPQEIAGFLATLLRPRGGQDKMTEKATTKTTRRNVGEIIQRGRIYYIRYYDVQGRRRLETTKSTKREDAEKQLRKRLSAKDAGVLPEAAIDSLTLKEATDDLIADYERNTRRGFLDRDQIDRICAALEATETAKDQRKRAGELANVVRFAFATGWRTTSEVLPLEWRHVDWKGRCVRLDAHTTKNDEGRSFPFTADLERTLTEQLAIHEQLKAAGTKAAGTICPFVFPRNGERISYFRSAWWNACKAAGCPDALVHDMRRSAVRTFERAGVPRSVAMSIVGHKTESIYRRYAIVDESMQREAAARLDAWMAAPPAAPSTATVTPLRQGNRLRGRVTG
jgi:integrase